MTGSSFLYPPPRQLFPAALQQLSQKIVQSRAHSTVIGVFTILLVFIAAFVNMVGTRGRGAAGGPVGHRLNPLAPPQFACSRVALRDCAARELNVTPEAVGPCQLRALNFSLGTPAGPCHRDGLACDFPEVSGCGAPIGAGLPQLQGTGTESCMGASMGPCGCKVLLGCWHRVPEDARCWQGVTVGGVSPSILEWGPRRCRVLA